MREHDPIVAAHPELFIGCFDFSVPTGWRALVAELCATLAKDPGCRVAQVKEKFGGLRVYVNNGTEAALAAINAAELLARKTCQACGAGGATLRTGGWARTLCDGCAK